MTCIDGVILGNTVTNILGIDMCTNWKQPDVYKNPIANELKKYLKNQEA
jgi:hypothetical protein